MEQEGLSGMGMEYKVAKEVGGAVTNTEDLWESHVETTAEVS